MPIQTQIADDLYSRGVHIIDNFLDLELYAKLRNTVQNLHNEGHFQPAKIGRKNEKKHNDTIRTDQIFWLDKPGLNNYITSYFTEIENICSILNQLLFLGIVDYEAHIAIYPPHSFYKKHVDQFSTTKERRISCVYYLNENWQDEFGGELKLYDKSDHLLAKVKPLGNRFVCFNSDIPHEVAMAYQPRWSIATWLKVRSMALTN